MIHALVEINVLAVKHGIAGQDGQMAHVAQVVQIRAKQNAEHYIVKNYEEIHSFLM